MATRRLSWANRIRRFCFRWCPPESVGGFELRVLLPERGELELACKKVGAALALIAEHDPRRFRRLARDLKRIWVGGTHNLGGYIADLDACILGHDYVASAETSPENIALTIAHEGVHARLAQVGIGYAEDERHRVERACVRAELALAERLPNGAALAEAAELRLNHDPEMWTDAALAERAQRALKRYGWTGQVGGAVGRALRAVEQLVR